MVKVMEGNVLHVDTEVIELTGSSRLSAANGGEMFKGTTDFYTQDFAKALMLFIMKNYYIHKIIRYIY